MADQDIERSLQILKVVSEADRRRTEQKGGLATAAISLFVIVIFLWILAIGRKRPMELAMAGIVIPSNIALFAWGLKTAIFGRSPIGSAENTVQPIKSEKRPHSQEIKNA